MARAGGLACCGLRGIARDVELTDGLIDRAKHMRLSESMQNPWEAACRRFSFSGDP